MRLKLFPKFLIVMSLAALVPLALLGYRLIDIGQLGVKTAILELHLGMADNVASAYRANIDKIHSKVVFLRDTIGRMDWDARQAVLTSFVDSSPEILEVSLVSGQGAEVMKVFSPSRGKDSPLGNYSGDPGFRSALDSKVRHISISSSTAEMVFFYPLGNAAAMRLTADISAFSATAGVKTIGDTGYALVVGPGGRPLALPPGLAEEEAAGIPAWPIVAAALAAPAAGSMEYADLAGREQIGAYAPIPDIGAAAVVKQSREEAYMSAIFMKDQAVYAILFFAVLVIIAAYLLSRQLSRPIIDVTRVAEHVASGDFTHTVQVDTGDELKDLGETFNKMIRQLKTYSDMQVDRIIREQKNTEAVLFSTEDAIAMADHDGKIQLVNRKARSVLGLPAGELVGMKFLDSIPDEKVRGVVGEVMSSEEPGFFRELDLSSATARTVYRCTATPIRDPKKKADLGLLVALHDITLDKELARLKDEFLHSITHDLRNPMGAVKGFVEFMLKEIPGPITDGQRKMLISIDRASFRLLGMINNILDAAKMEAGKMEISLAPVNMGEAARRVVELMESLGQRKRIKFAVDAPPDLVVSADPGLMERMFTNLVGNAIKFTPEDGTITLRVSSAGGMVTGEVEDTGDGIPQEYLGRIFEKFEQVKGQKAGGTGLGLTICKNVAASHLGKIWAESESGKGARFIFSFPADLRKDESGAVKPGGA
ncbi:MAG: two-component system NtrC family sensor histidine kinase KinB [Elusimicrobia bacterium]|nr:MAG: two-component system NtrC family sensor histidine kinase KinB [Elusimicrobiota bacterium]KAF0155616.1 MAG: two-component system NtrC family sensor histidine kinase KinB [Elusimicrobiota bacterium]